MDHTWLINRVLQGEVRAIARAISVCENNESERQQLRSKLPSVSQSFQVTGVTGAPGSGKSSLVDALARLLRNQGQKVAIIAVDPSSPFSGGALLGDRIRMSRVSQDEGVFIRSMATRGALGGVSAAVHDAIWILGVAGFDHVLVETVGVGQVEVDIVQVADTCMLLLVPGLGDSIQTFKAGIMEIADLFVVNKADRDGSDLVERDLNYLLALREFSAECWRPPVLRTNALSAQGVEAVLEQVRQHRTWLDSSAWGQARRQRVLENAIARLASELWARHRCEEKGTLVQELASKCLKRQLEISQAAEILLNFGK